MAAARLPLPGWRLIAAYTWLDQFYVDYTEQLTAGALTARFDRAGNKIPGVAPNELVSSAAGALAVEFRRDSYICSFGDDRIFAEENGADGRAQRFARRHAENVDVARNDPQPSVGDDAYAAEELVVAEVSPGGEAEGPSVADGERVEVGGIRAHDAETPEIVPMQIGTALATLPA